MDEGDLVDAKLPADFLATVKRSPTKLKLVAKAKVKKSSPTTSGAATTGGTAMKGRGRVRGGGGGSMTIQDAASDAVPLGRRTTRRQATEAARKNAAAAHEVIVLD